MSSSTTSARVPSAAGEAASLVRDEWKRRQRAAHTPSASGTASVEEEGPGEGEPAMETVSVVEWEGADARTVDESELSRRQRAIAEKLRRRQLELARDSREIERVRADLAALEAPLKAEINSIRTALEEANKREVALVAAVNELRAELRTKQIALETVRGEKQQHADKLIDVMADYEQRKTNALNGIARLVGEEPVEVGETQAVSRRKNNFEGF